MTKGAVERPATEGAGAQTETAIHGETIRHPTSWRGHMQLRRPVTMTLTDALMGAAALWLLFVVCGVPGQRSRAPGISLESTSLSRFAPSPRVDVAPYSVWYEELPQPRYVTPPLPEDTGFLGNPGDLEPLVNVPENAYASLGSATVYAIGLPQVLSLTEVTIAPGGDLTLANLGGSGLIVLEVGWLELAEQDGNALLTRSPLAEPTALHEAEGPLTIAPGDRLAFGPGATIVLRNRGENPARVLAASVVAMPGLDA